ncbi:MAG: nuclear transport factor 2 family protein [Xanthomonadales bacterium]|nr:hypothetical protein [Xanthomonadales bacterium]MCC6592981.1 nuclear transport factor 2 family protein [Xanthomonadales bacterium]
MRPLSGCCLLIASACALAQDAPPTPPPMSAAECEVWSRERSFAASVEAHDGDAFRAHIHPDAAFIESKAQIVRGREAIAQSWAGILAGEEIVLRWHPERVTIAGDGGVASSRGPYWVLNPKLEQEPRWLIGEFSSIWVRGKDGRWLVLMDGVGGNQTRQASEEDVNRLKSTLKATCP